jgi:3-hydroxyisobutyrate dehydrogenase-like beta-hydroxyacid dehydrogenase
MTTSIGIVGLGLMGDCMATRLLNAGYKISVFNRTKEKAQSLIASGAKWCESPKSVASQSEIVLSMVSNSDALLEIATGKEGVLHGLQESNIHIDMSTVSPVVTRQLGEEYAKKKCSFLHSPVLGSVPQATDGSLLLFVGGRDEPFRRAEDVLRILGSKIWRFDLPEQASHTKLLCNLFIAGMGTTLAQALVYATKASVNPETLLDIISHSSLSAPMYQTKGKSILERNFTPRFFVEHMLKDVNLILESGRTINAPLPTARTAEELFSAAVRAGYGKEDYSAVVKVIEQQAGVEVKKQ